MMENRAAARDVYLPQSTRGMAHRSYPSPDGQWALVVEMDRAMWLPCRLVSLGGDAVSRPVGPPGAPCTSAAWAPDGETMFLNSSAGGTFHIWRQAFPDGQPEQITSGLSEEEGVAMAADGRSFVTAVGQRQSVVWVHDGKGERQISLEGFSYDPKFSPDGTKLYYRILGGPDPINDPGEVRVVDLQTGQNEPLLPGFPVTGYPGRAYNVSRDGQWVVAATRDRDGKRGLWRAALDRQSPPRQILNIEGDMPFFGTAGEILFRAIEGPSAFLYRLAPDDDMPTRVSEQAIVGVVGVSGDGNWVLARVADKGWGQVIAFPLRGGTPRPIVPIADNHFGWSMNGLFLSVPASSGSALELAGKTYVVPLPPGQAFPPIPAGGFQSESDIAGLPGVKVIDAFDVAPGPTSDVYAYSRQTTQRNLYRIPVP